MRTIKLLGLLIIAVLLVSACSASSSLNPPTPAPATPTEAPKAPPTPTPYPPAPTLTPYPTQVPPTAATPVPPTPPTAVPKTPVTAPTPQVAQPPVPPSGGYRIGCTGKDVGAVQAEIGLSVVCLGTEYDAYTWRSVPLSIKARVPQGYIATLHLQDDKIVVTQTPGEYMIQAGTFRRIKGYPPSDAVYDACRLLEKEREFGRNQSPSFPVEPLGFTCPSGSAASLTPQQGQPASAAPPPAAVAPTLDPSEVASWCNPDCSSRLKRLVESNGKENPAGIKLTQGDQCFSVTVPDNISYDIWAGPGGYSGQEAKTLPRVCEGSFRKNS